MIEHDGASVNGTVQPQRRTRRRVNPALAGSAASPGVAASPALAAAGKGADGRRVRAARSACWWGRVYTGGAVLLSAGLNGYACHKASWAGAVLGAAVPLLVLVLAQVACQGWRAGWRRWAIVPGVVACVLLALSLSHCAEAFACLTGTGLVLSFCLAVGVDVGLVASEATAILVGE